MDGGLVGTPLNSIILQSPGTLGLNTQSKDDVIDQRYCTAADNCVIDRSGRLAARKGWSKINSTAATGTPDIDNVHSYINGSGEEKIVSTGGNKIWTGDTTLTDSTGSVSVTADNWKFSNINGNVVGFQASHEPIWWNGTGNFEYLVDQNSQWAAATAYALGDIIVPTTRNGYYYHCTTAGTSAGAEPTWSTTLGGTTADNTATWTTREIPKSNEVLSAFGRTWIISADFQTIHYSDLLIPSAYHGGSAGSIGLQSVLTGGNDYATSLAVHNNNLVIFCKNSIVIYANADDVGNLALVEVVQGIGCIARDSVQSIGTDLLFLSKGGLRSLGRTVIQDKMPISEVSYNVREDLVTALDIETVSLIKSTYNERLGAYILNMPTSGQVFYFDLALYNQNIARIMIWTLSVNALCTRQNGNLIYGMDAGFLGIYNTYQDNGSSYVAKYRSGWIDVGLNTIQAIWKEMIAYFGSELDVNTVASWSFNFDATEKTLLKTITGGNVAEYGVSEYGIGEYGSVFNGGKIKYPISGTGAIIRVGIQATVDNGNIAFNKIELYFKDGKNKL